MHPFAYLSIGVLLALLAPAIGHGAELSQVDRTRLLEAYPGLLERIDGNDLVWRDGTRMPLDDGKGDKPFEQWLDNPDIADMFAIPYPVGAEPKPPAKNIDPGRARTAAFFDKVYGDCRNGAVEKNLTIVEWLPTKAKQKLPFNKMNGAAAALAAASRELDALAPSFDVFLTPSAGTYNCRVIAGTNRVSAHGHAIAIDIALKRSHYWRNDKPGKDGALPYKNDIPMEIVRIFEKHGFIWGGHWYHYDTMHFEYRPELIGVKGGAAAAAKGPQPSSAR
jgi:hypothetical protein